MARLLEAELAKREGELAEACVAVNADSRIAEEIDEWQAFDDVLPPTRPAERLGKGRE